MRRSALGFGAALIAAALASAADAQTDATQRHPPKHHVDKQAEGGQAADQKGTPSWLTLGSDAQVGGGANYVTGAFDQPSSVQGTFSGYRGRERTINQYGVPGAPLFAF